MSESTGLPSRMEVVDYPTHEVHRLIKSGRMLDAWQLAQTTGKDLKDWPAGEPRRAAARLAGSLGGNRLQSALNWLNWRRDRENPRYYFQGLFTRIRFVPEYKLIPEVQAFLARHPEMDPHRRADLLAFIATIHAGLRDFPPAFQLIEEALQLRPEDSWIQVEHTSILTAADRYEDALTAAREAVRLAPSYGPAIQYCADALVHLGADDEAIALLEEASATTQNASFPARLQVLYSEREDHQRALACLDQIAERSPLAEPDYLKWLAGRRADFHFMAGDLEKCLEWCDRKGEGYQKNVAERLRQPGTWEKKRVHLDVPFTRQHSMTCAPATLSSIASYWGKPHDHLAIADAICHDGTPWHKERQWASEQGFVTREFRLTRDSLHQLIDRGVPFTLTTQTAISAHLQACTGYDDRVGTVLLRDPTERHYGEIMLDSLIESHPMAGPRAMILITEEEAHRLDGIVLPDEAAYDAHFELLVAIDSNDRMRIEAAQSALNAIGGDSPLVLEGQERVAFWKGDWPGQLAIVEAQLAIAPEYEAALLQKAYILRRLGRWQDLRAFLEEMVGRKNADPVFTSELGELLMEDARLLERAEHFLRRAVRSRRREGRVYESLARCYVKQLRHDEAIVLRRFASSLTPTFEPYAKAHFETCRVLRRVKEGLEFLRERTKRFGHKDGGPWITLAEALDSIARDHEAAAVLEEGSAARPGDGIFLLSAGSMMVKWGEPYRSKGLQWIEDSKASAPETRWLHTSARCASMLGDRRTAIRRWRTLIELQPHFIDPWRGLARSIAEEEGEAATIAFLDEATKRHPERLPLWTLKAEWLVGTARGPLEALDRALEIDPDDAWTRRERASRRRDAGDLVGAEADAREALALDPWSAESHGTLGFILQAAGRKEEAAECYRNALRQNIDYTFAAGRLVHLQEDRSSAMEAIRFIAEEMRRQVSTGEILPTYQQLAWQHLEPPVLLSELQQFCEERPDLWQTWSARIDQSLRMQLDGEALHAAEKLVEIFPLLPRAWIELAMVHRTAGRHAEEESAAARAVELSPGWDKAAREYAHVLEMRGKTEEAVAVLARACELEPLSGANHGRHAEALRRLGRKSEALDKLRKALITCPFYGTGWNIACQWATEDERIEELKADLEAATKEHAHHPAWCDVAADAWDLLGDHEKTMEAIRLGLEKEPKDANFRDRLASQHFSQQRYDEALKACEPVEDEEQAPVSLRGRHAWILLHSGQPARGIAAMNELIEQEPDYAWGLAELASWFHHHGDWQQLRDHCKRWRRVDPDNVRVLGYLGMAERELKQPDAAKACFARAHALDPEYEFAARQLLELQIEAKEFDQAIETLSSLEYFTSGPAVLCDRIELELKRGQSEQAREAASTLLDHPEASASILAWAAEAFRSAGNTNTWRSLLTERFNDGTPAAPGALAAYLAIMPPKRMLKDGRKAIDRAAPGSESRIAAWEFLIDHLAKSGGADKLKSWAKSRSPELHQNGRLWNALGLALVDINAAKEGVAWFSDWRDRPDDVKAETLINLAVHYEANPGDEEKQWQHSGEVRKVAYERFRDGRLAQAIRAGHAYHLAAAGDCAQAREILTNFNPDQTTDYYRAMGKAASAIVAAHDGDQENAKSATSSALSFFGQYNDLGSVRIRDRLLKSLASQLPWTKGSIRRLRKKWFLPKAQNSSSPSIESPIPMWVIVIILVVFMKACAAFATR